MAGDTNIEASTATFKDDAFGVGDIAESVLSRGGAIVAAVLPGLYLRAARTKSRAQVIQAQTDAQVEDIRERAKLREAHESVRQQEALEDIAMRAARIVNESAPKMLPPGTTTPKVSEDWADNFAEQAKNVSDTELRDYFARILADEAITPGTFTKRTVNTVRMLERSEAKSFVALCQLTLNEGEILVAFTKSPFFPAGMALPFDEIEQLAAIGLVRTDHVAGYQITYNHPAVTPMLGLSYGKKKIGVDFSHAPQPNGVYQLQTGNAMFTEQGKQLRRIVQQKYSDEVLTHMVDSLRVANAPAIVRLLPRQDSSD